ncbi:MAG: hypothetical protein QMD94_05645 [Candidatus Omnitrophota bacterium]|nr:hypothetical protein [Candidatus Omnitrophota bacterium]
MNHRGYIPSRERQARSKLAKIIHGKPFLQGSIVKRASKCGKDNCWCAKESIGHTACYLSIRIGKKRKMIGISGSFEKDAREWVMTYRQINKQIARVSQYCLERIK